mmetsp:Transcript_1570/g.4931  ORF Transcript_1570/g.4931 Transcript_1570/m.4931 type:complete len:400 (-) Transcript_1570:2170-3369(-)
MTVLVAGYEYDPLVPGDVLEAGSNKQDLMSFEDIVLPPLPRHMVFKWLRSFVAAETVIQVIAQRHTGTLRIDSSDQMGWAIFALYCTFVWIGNMCGLLVATGVIESHVRETLFHAGLRRGIIINFEPVKSHPSRALLIAAFAICFAFVLLEAMVRLTILNAFNSALLVVIIFFELHTVLKVPLSLSNPTHSDVFDRMLRQDLEKAQHFIDGCISVDENTFLARLCDLRNIIVIERYVTMKKFAAKFQYLSDNRLSCLLEEIRCNSQISPIERREQLAELRSALDEVRNRRGVSLRQFLDLGSYKVDEFKPKAIHIQNGQVETVDMYTSWRSRRRRTLVGTFVPIFDMFPNDWGESYFVDSELCTIHNTGLVRRALQLYLVTVLLYCTLSYMRYNLQQSQ